MKKIMCAVLAAVLVLTGLTACGGKEETVSYRLEAEESGMPMVDTMTFHAKEDKIYKLEEEIVMDMSDFSEEDFASVQEIYNTLLDQFNAVEGVEATGSAEGQVYTMNISADATGNAISELAEAGLMQVEGDATGISLTKTGENLEASGYTKVE